MTIVRSQTLTEDTRRTRTLLMTVSVLMVLVLILGITINKLEVFGVEITFGRAHLLMALMVANVYLTIS